MPGPLSGLRLVEFVGLGPAPFCAMLFADLGAEVIRIDRPGAGGALGVEPRHDLPARGRRSLVLDLRSGDAREAALQLVARADALIEGYRPGVMERLGLGPDDCLARQPKLVYGRMTGWGQTGPLAQTAGHDIDYLALSGALHAIGRAGAPPVPPLNYVADYGGGAMLLAFGLLAALHEARGSGLGQVVDAAMIDGASLLSTMFHGLRAAGQWSDQRGENLLDGGAPYYDCYACADGRHVAVGAIEPQFQAELLQRLGLAGDFTAPVERPDWPRLRARLTSVFATRTRADWTAVFEGSDACVAPVLSFAEAPRHPQHAARGSFVEVDGLVQPAPAPRFSRTPAATPGAPARPGAHGEAILHDWGVDAALIARLRTGA
ncbi:MAG TPA: CaiB/BaiF CoA-transferase family protein [Methylibium sp.]|nr:CaiB/BaiF CoA-transferase family protein [Methylibium sp.]